MRHLAPLAFCCMLLLSAQAHAQVLRIGSWDQKTDPLTIGSEAVLVKAYGELKQPVEFIDLPLRRAMSMMLVGELDGNLHRIAELADQEPGLVRVGTSISSVVVRLYTSQPGLVARDWKQLAGLSVAYRRGVLVIERNLGPGIKRVEAKSEADALRMAAAGVVDLALAAESAQAPVHVLATGGKLRRQDAVLHEVPLYHYLRNSHRALAERLDLVLKRMRAAGEIDAIHQRVRVPAIAPDQAER
jgi:ABC-type amino acid transport substrate-binding protein